MTLQQIFDFINDTSRTGAVTVPSYIKTEFNKLTAAGITAMTDTEASALSTVIENRLTKLLPCNTIYDINSQGESAVKRILKYNLYSLVVEIRNMVKAISKDIATSHSRSKFNPIDNTDIDNAADETDLQSFSYVNNMITQIDYLNENSKTLGKIYRDFSSICYTMSTSSTSGEGIKWGDIGGTLASQTDLQNALDSLEDYCDSLDATKASQEDLDDETTAREAADVILQTNIDNKLDLSKCTYQTTTPTAAAVDGGVHIVYLESEPSTYYDGYIYMIKED